VRRIIREVSGFAPYEKRITEMLRAGTAKETKKAMKLAKKRLGTFTRAKAKREFLLGVIAATWQLLTPSLVNQHLILMKRPFLGRTS